METTKENTTRAIEDLGLNPSQVCESSKEHALIAIVSDFFSFLNRHNLHVLYTVQNLI